MEQPEHNVSIQTTQSKSFLDLFIKNKKKSFLDLSNLYSLWLIIIIIFCLDCDLSIYMLGTLMSISQQKW